MKTILVIILSFLVGSSFAEGEWSTDRLASFLRGSCRFIESDCDETDASDDIPGRMRDALPLFRDVFQESGWTTNELVDALIAVVSNGLQTVNLQDPDMRRSAVVAMRQLADINHPAVTNFFRCIVYEDLHGMEKIAIPGLFRYTNLESNVVDRLYDLCVCTNRYDEAASIVAWDLLDCLATVPEAEREGAKIRVAKYMYYSMRHISTSQTWQDEELAKLIPSYSNSVQRLDQTRFFIQNSTNAYERSKALVQYNRLSTFPTNSLNDVSWIGYRAD